MRIEGFRAAGVSCGIKADAALDLALIASDRPASLAGVFTRNRFPGAPVRVSRARVRRGLGRAVVVNSGVANVATGPEGLADARAMARSAARGLGVREGWVTVASTGVIGPPLPLARIEAAMPLAIRSLSASGWGRASRAILTTDTRPKRASIEARGFRLGGIAKGAGMTMPQMATMLSFLATDLAVEPRFLREALREAVEPTFNALTIDGETSTSDSVLIFANGAAGNRPLGSRSARAPELRRGLREVCGALAEQLARDGEGVSKLADIHVSGARSKVEAERVARSVANSLLVKTALFGRDPNWGRIVQAVGAAGVRLVPERLGVRLAGVDLLRGGRPTGGEDALRRAARGLRRPRVAIEVSLGLGRATAHVLTTDLTYEYVRINAEYTS